jgi:NOL1/NOP2/fmu family ribosome biogenesis protein
LAGEDDRACLLAYMYERFGIPADTFNDYLLFTKKKTFWFVRKSPLLSDISHLKIKRIGIKAFQEVGRFIKPTTRIIQYIGHRATRAVFNVDEEQLRKLLKGEYLSCDNDLENGYVILSLKGQVLGLGLLIKGEVRSQLPSEDVRYLTI